MTDRIEPVRRDDAPRHVPAVTPAARRERRHEEDARRRRERPRPPQPITRDDDGTPHVDVRA
jgi:hypothetical protein